MRELFQLNYNFGEAEKQAEELQKKQDSLDFFQRHLHEKLLFRRAGGAVVGKEKFLSDLSSPDNKTTQLSSYGVEVTESEDEKTAVVSLLVRLEGTRGGQDATGTYRNLRLFVKDQNNVWQCLVWFNTRVKGGV
jgi:hypothetical protein